MTNIFFTSDPHYWHKNAIAHCNRPFATLEEMHSELISRWNERVKDIDHVYLLGDLSFGNPSKTEEILKQLKGIKFLIRGNHDKKLSDAFLLQHFKWVKDYYVLKIEDIDAPNNLREIVLFHFALRTWEKIHYGVWHLFGHSHGNMKLEIMPSMDVGVDCHNYYPISYEEVKAKLKNATPTFTDHHKM